MTTDQLSLPIARLAEDKSIPKDLSIQERFERFHKLNPWVFESFEKLTADWLERGQGRVGIGMLAEVIRWQYARATDGDSFRINNTLRSRYARALIEKHPEWADAFETRALRSA